MEAFKWQYIQFENGSNPYICTEEKNFKRMRRKYRLVKIEDGYWLAKKSLSELLSELNEINDFEEFRIKEFEVVAAYCREKKFRLSAKDRFIIAARGLESAINAIR